MYLKIVKLFTQSTALYKTINLGYILLYKNIEIHTILHSENKVYIHIIIIISISNNIST